MMRYVRQTVLKEFGLAAQEKLSKAKVLVIGVGGLGIPVLQYLNAMGVGTLGLVEADTIDITNLQRQVLYTEAEVGASKLATAVQKLKAQNSTTVFKQYNTFLTKENVLDIVSGFDVVVDASDNFATRYLVNDACVILKKPFVSGAIQGFEGQLSVFNYKGGPTYRCLFPNMPSANEIPNCNDNGVLGVVPGIIGNLQALETVKLIAGIGEVLSGELLLFNGLHQSYNKIKFTAVKENLERTVLEDSYGDNGCSLGASINIQDFIELVHTKTSFQLLDVRTIEEYNTYHIPNSTHIPLTELGFHHSKIEKETTVYVICQSGKRSKMAQNQLLEIEITVINVEGGINAYRSLEIAN
ncbi:HesA/MoeB/ThiF family protein [Cellulophaga sp. 20_2_10]|uniref:HesA/MoeB/ThiF family protein n=1 Tax=Cellulophaga sp. 20_2_10 TaxID=2942476 RepID=UPI00201AC996|nr:HesA/MoeB/ThiF family protein [Cellulophaga sp. 20_2_10]MCL5244607.1 HesA/MoeB/ThiF family protein [Cellulophaga sp. 20_2_10]